MTGIPPILPDILQNQIAQLGLPNPMEGLPPGQPINPMMAFGDASQGPQGPINPMAGPAGGGGDGLSALFGGAPGQGGGADALSAAGGALAQSGASQGDFTPSTLTSIVNAVQAGRGSLEEGKVKQIAQAALEERRKLLRDADTPTKRRTAFQEILEQAVVSGDPTQIENASTALEALDDPDKFDFETVDNTLYQFNEAGELVGVFGGGKEQDVLGELTDRQFDRVKVPLTDFNQSTAGIREVPTQFRRVVTSATPLANLPENATAEEIKDLSFAAVSALSSYARLIDPNSVVRTSEMELLLGQGSWAEKLETLIKRAVSGTMSPALARALINEAKAQTKAQKESYEGFVNQFAEQANAFAGITPEQARRLVINPYDELDIDNPNIPARELESAEDEDEAGLIGTGIGGVVQLIDEL